MRKKIGKVVSVLSICLLLLGVSITASAETPYPESGQANIGNYQINYGSVYMTNEANIIQMSVAANEKVWFLGKDSNSFDNYAL